MMLKKINSLSVNKENVEIGAVFSVSLYFCSIKIKTNINTINKQNNKQL